MAEEKQNTGTEVVFHDENHIFLLRRFDHPNTPFVQVDFSPLPSPQNLPTPHPRTAPSFNPDGLFYTPAFTLPVDLPKTAKYQDAYLKLHEERRAEMSQEREELFVPKPSKGNSFCCICKAAFEDYLTHISLPHHQQLLRTSPFRAEISSLALQFNSQSDSCKEKEQGKSHRIKKSAKKVRTSCRLKAYLSSTTLCNSASFQQKQLML